MKKVVVAIVVSAVSFAAGLGGLFFALPLLAPERVSEARQQLDSLGYVFEDPDSIAVLPEAFIPDTAGVELTETDSMVIATDSLPDPLPPAVALKSAAIDSTEIFRRLLAGATEENKSLKKQMDALQAEVKALRVRQAEASSVGATLSKLEDKELSKIVSQLDLDTLNLLYQQASPRNQSRLLAAMSADRAARLVRNLIKPGSAPEPIIEASEPVSDAGATE